MTRRVAATLTLSLLLVAACGGGSDSTPDNTLGPTPDTVVGEGAASSEEAVAEWYRGIGTSDAPRMWSVLDPVVRAELRQPAWDACVSVGFPERPDVQTAYNEDERYTEGDSTFSTGSVTIDGDFEVVTITVTYEVVERDGTWFTLGEEAREIGESDGGEESCIVQSLR